MILCPICKKEFKDRRCFGLHLSRSHRTHFNNEVEREQLLVETLFGRELVENTKQEYIDGKYCISDLPVDIAKYLSLLGIKRTSKQERATERYKKKYTDSIIEKYGVDNISKATEVKNKKAKTCTEKHGGYSRYLEHQRQYMSTGYRVYSESELRRLEQQSKATATYIAKYGCDNPAKNAEVRAKLSQTQKSRIAKLSDDERLKMTSKARESVCHRGGYSSKPEKRVRKSLIDLNIEALYNKHIWDYNWDLVIGTFLIEVQGTMWHAKPGIYKETDLIMGKLLAKDIWTKDAKKHKKAKEEGYTVIEIWEDEIAKCNDIELTELIRERLEYHGFYN